MAGEEGPRPAATQRRSDGRLNGAALADPASAGGQRAGRDLGRVARLSPRDGAGGCERGDNLSGVAAVELAAQKKGLTSSERNPDKRAWWWRRIGQCEVERLKFI